MSQTQITGKCIGLAAPYQTATFVKQTALVEIVNGSYTSFMPIDFTQADVQNLVPLLQQNGVYTFTCYVQGSNKTFTDKNGQPTAYISLKCTALVPAQQQAPAQPAYNAPAPAAQQQGFGGQPAQPQGGFVGAPQASAPQQNNFGGQPAPSTAPATGGFGQPQQSSFGGGDPNQANGFGNNKAAPNTGGNFGNPSQPGNFPG